MSEESYQILLYSQQKEKLTHYGLKTLNDKLAIYMGQN